MKANQNIHDWRHTIQGVVSKIVEKKNESKSQLRTNNTVISSSCVKDR